MKLLRTINNILLIVCIFLVPLLLIILGLSISNKWSIGIHYSDTWRYVILGLGFLLLGLGYIEAKFSKGYGSEIINDLKSEFNFLFSHGRYAWAIGGAASCIFLGIFLLFRSNHDLSHRYHTGFAIFSAILAITLAVEVLYRRMAPIIGTEKLLDLIARDIRNVAENDSSIYIVYAALNIGFYRGFLVNQALFTGSEHDRDSPLGKFEAALRSAVIKSTRRSVVITYAKALYKPLYEAYDSLSHLSQKQNIPNDKIIGECVKSAECLLKIFEDQSENGQRKKKVIVKAINPDEEAMPHDIVIIGDIVYLITSYGLPIYKKAIGFQMPSETHEVADLITWRRQDPILARTIIRRLMKECNLVDDQGAA